jgi:hypothetical protein
MRRESTGWLESRAFRKDNGIAEASFSTRDLFDTDRYPVNRRGTAAWREALSAARRGLQSQNCTQLADVIRPTSLAAPLDEDRHSLLLSYVADPTNIVSIDKAVRFSGEAHPRHSGEAARTENSDDRLSN